MLVSYNYKYGMYIDTNDGQKKFTISGRLFVTTAFPCINYETNKRIKKNFAIVSMLAL